MNLKAVLGAASLLLVAQSAFAQRTAPPANPQDPLDAISAYLRLVHKPYSEQVVVSPQGRADRVFETRATWQQTLEFYQDAYKTSRSLPSEVTCGGWFVVASKRIATFTLYQGPHKFMIVMNDGPDGARLTVWGVPFGVHPKEERRRPFHQTLAPEPPIRYGL